MSAIGAARPRRVAVLGSTGSIGRNALDVIARSSGRLALAGIAGHSRIDILAEQWGVARPPLVSVWDGQRAAVLAAQLGVPVLSGLEGLIELATHPDIDIVLVATSGQESLLPTIRAIQAGKRVALASKELLVMAGHLMMPMVRQRGTSLVPVDSEHAALFQCLQGVRDADVARLTITGSGGPLRELTSGQAATVSREQVLAHPKWRMGPKITVDSATLMNKGLELIEARWLFGVPFSRLRVVIHPEAAVHALVELTDGTMLAQLSPCDMRMPIQFALSFPERWPSDLAPLDLTRLGGLTFQEPDEERFPCLRLAREAARQGPSACVVLNAANDVAVRAYLEDGIPFADIPRIIHDTLERHEPASDCSLEDVLALDAWARAAAKERLHQCSLP